MAVTDNVGFVALSQGPCGLVLVNGGPVPVVCNDAGLALDHTAGGSTQMQSYNEQ